MNRFSQLLNKYGSSPAPQNSLDSINNRINGPGSELYEGSMPSQSYQEKLNQGAAPTIQLRSGESSSLTPAPTEEKSGGFDIQSLMKMMPGKSEEPSKEQAAAPMPQDIALGGGQRPEANMLARAQLLEDFKNIRNRGGSYGP